MKKGLTIVIGALLLLAAPKSFAQLPDVNGNWSFGAGFTSLGIGGSDASRLKDLGFPNSIPGFYFGLNLDYFFSSLENLSVEPGVNIAHYGKSFRFGLASDDKSYHANYINIPINLKYKFEGDGGMNVALFTGPRFNLGIGGNMFSTGKTYPGLKVLDAQWGFGASVTLAEAIQIRGSYDIGLSKNVKDNKDLLLDNEIINHRGFSVGLNFLF